MKFECNIIKNSLCKFGKFILIIIFLLLVLSSISIKSEDAFRTVGFRPYRVTSNNMETKFYEDDLIIVINKNNIKLKQNDIMAFAKDDESVISRVLHIKENNNVVSKGDNSEEVLTVRHKDIIGKVSFGISKAGFVVNYLSNPYIIIMEIFIFILLIFQFGKHN